MKEISKFIVKRYKLIFFIFLIASIFSGFMMLLVEINFSLASYMPKDAESMIAIEKMKEDFDEPIPNLRIAIKDVSVVEVLEYKSKLDELPEVKMSLWMDRFVNPYGPVEVIDKNFTDTFYKDGTALIQVSVESQNSKQALDKIKQILPENTAYEGVLVSEASAQNAVTSEISTITAFAVPVGLLILMFAVKSWIEPILLLVAIGVAILINLGTNIILGKISFVTQSVSSILQLAVSLDYAVFLLHEFENQKKVIKDTDEALAKAIEVSASSVVSSALTTVFGFLVLIFMRFGIGKDLGLVLAKGIFFSLISVIFFLPSLIKISLKLIDKTEHRSFLPNFTKFSKLVINSRWLILLLVVVIPIAFLAQKKNDFTYGMGAYESGSKEEIDERFIEDTFGRSTQIVVLVPKGDLVREDKLISEFKELSNIYLVQSYTEQAGKSIPLEIAPKDDVKSIIGEKFSRIILYSNGDREGERAFSLVKEIEEIALKYYQDFEILGESVTLNDMSKIVSKDNQLVNLLAILSVAIVIMINFRSLLIPVILVLTIEASIWINLSIPYFTNTKLSFIGYLIISSIQLGATVDYAILYTDEYLKQREVHDKNIALIETGKKIYGSIIPPALILLSAGIILSIVSSISLVSELGTVLGRGAFLSLFMVSLLLPVFIYFTDDLIRMTTWKKLLKRGSK